jgi:hypothetical protein
MMMNQGEYPDREYARAQSRGMLFKHRGRWHVRCGTCGEEEVRSTKSWRLSESISAAGDAIYFGWYMSTTRGWTCPLCASLLPPSAFDLFDSPAKNVASGVDKSSSV